MPSPLPRRIVVLVHARDRDAETRPYQIWGIAEIWRSWGIEVIVQHGIRQFLDADVVVNHVDLTVVPAAYVHYMEQYEVAINRRCTDISKRLVSHNLVRRPEECNGPVIIKTDLNFGGELERLVHRGRAARAWGELRLRLSRRPWRVRRFLATHDYVVLESAEQVPPDVWRNPHLVVERFLPERDGDLYAVRKLTFLGDRFVCRRSLSTVPVIKSENVIRAEEVQPHADVFAEARRLRLDRGRFDYVLHAGRPVIFDANRTNTMGPSMTSQRSRETYERLAPGLGYFWPPRQGQIVKAPEGSDGSPAIGGSTREKDAAGARS